MQNYKIMDDPQIFLSCLKLIYVHNNKTIMNESPLILIYLDFKGMAQVARHLLCYLDIEFVDVLLDKLEEQRNSLPACIFQRLKGVKIDKTMLPILIHQEYVIQQLFPIMSYLCIRFGREDLMGKDCFQKAKVQELIEIYINSLPHTQSILFELADTAAVIEEDHLLPTIQAYYKRLIRESGYMKQLCDYILQNGSITILDFYYVESSNYTLGLYGSLNKQLANKNWKEKSENYSKKIRGLHYLQIMNGYQQKMKNLPYYLCHQKYLQSFRVIGSLMSPMRAKGFRRIWAIEMSQVAQ